MKLLHVGLCVSEDENGFQKAFKDVLGKENYFELSTGEQYLNVKILQKYNECKPDIVFFQIQAENIVSNQTFDYLKSNGDDEIGDGDDEDEEDNESENNDLGIAQVYSQNCRNTKIIIFLTKK